MDKLKKKKRSLIKEEEKWRLLFLVKEKSIQPHVTVVKETKQNKTNKNKPKTRGNRWNLLII